MLKVFLPILVAALVSSVAAAQEVSERRPRVLHAVKTEVAPAIDGLVDEEVWFQAEPATDFTQQQPAEGMPATERTEVRVLYDDIAIYFGVICYDSEPDKIVVTQSRRDGSLDETDSFQVILDTYHDRQNGFVFGTTPVGIEYDAQVTQEARISVNAPPAFGGGQQRGALAGFNLNWDGAWRVKARITERGWEAEFAIPFKTLRFSSRREQSWGINFWRNVRRKNEQSFWAPIPRAYNLYRVSMAGTLEGLVIRADRNLKLIPFVIGGVEQDLLRAGDKTRPLRDAGLDVKYGISSNLTLDVTLNTDFAQTEVDEEQVNLTRFSLFFPEKRPFFLENAGFFQFGVPQEVDIFFSRRIGISDSGELIPIVGGARLTGKADRFKLGLLSMQTERVPGEAPSNNFTVARISREFHTRSSVGAIFVNRQGFESDKAGADHNRVWGFDTAIGVGDKLTVLAFLAKSHTPGLVGKDYAGRVYAEYQSNLWHIRGGYLEAQDNFNPEVGFLRRVGFRKPDIRVNFTPEPKSRWIRRFNPHVFWSAHYDLKGDKESESMHNDFVVVFQNGSEFSIELNRNFERIDAPFDIFPGVIIPPGKYSWNRGGIEYITDQSARLFLQTQYQFGGFYDGRIKTLNLNGGFRVGPKFLFVGRLNYNDVDLPAGDFSTTIASARISYSFTPHSFLQGLFQYNDRFDQFTSNIRLALLRSSNTGLFFVYLERRATGAGAGLLNRAFIVKYTHLFDF